MKKIILFGGSFDPIHLGHIHIALSSLKELDADKVVFIPAFSPRWKDLLASSEDRLNMLKLAIKDYPQFEINTIELDSKEDVNYTYTTVKRIIKKEKAEYYLLIGSDQQNKLDKWYKIDELSKLVRIICYKRKNEDFNIDLINKYNCKIINAKVFNQSSTEIRMGSKLYAPKAVLDYIINNKLYFMNKLESFLNDKRLKHSISVANLSYEIAQKNSLDKYNAFQAGLFHDIGKYFDEINTNIIMKRYYKPYNIYDKATYHQFIGNYLAKKEFNIKNKKVLDAIKYHCTGNAKLNDLGMIVYASDKIDPLRGYDSSKMIYACLDDYLKGFKLVLKENVIYLALKDIKTVHPLTEACINYYKPMEGK